MIAKRVKKLYLSSNIEIHIFYYLNYSTISEQIQCFVPFLLPVWFLHISLQFQPTSAEPEFIDFILYCIKTENKQIRAKPTENRTNYLPIALKKRAISFASSHM